jgi:hypothetical protein
VQNKLEQLLKEVILPNQDFKVAHRWSGIMGIGLKARFLSYPKGVYCAVRLGNMEAWKFNKQKAEPHYMATKPM